MWSHYEFFAGGGLARLGLGKRWRCAFANEISEKKANAYRLNFGPSPELRVGDVRLLTSSDLPARAELAWASFPCQDLSQAGNGLGLEGKRSSTFWPFWSLMESLAAERRAVPLVVLENVVGAITSNGGRDFAALAGALTGSGYNFGPLVVDAARFVPQSRPRLFILAVRREVAVSAELLRGGPSEDWHTRSLCDAWSSQQREVRESWLWWRLPVPPLPRLTLTDIVDDHPDGVAWHTADETGRLVAMMSETNLAKVRKAQALGKRIAGTVYKRIRVDEAGTKVQRAEVRFDQIGGCLRTPVGGSSRQSIMLVEGHRVRTRLLSPREAARMMGADSYKLPSKYNDAYHVMGDGLVVPVVSWLEKHLLRPLASTLDERLARVA